ncbi:MAG TPA: YkgJ family cysteine cluster protein [Myxococcales bacterium]|jgi:Fe-S-cluster containining protein
MKRERDGGGELEGLLDDERPLPRVVVERKALHELDAVFREADALLSRTGCSKSGECCRLAVTKREPFLLPLERLRLERGLAKQGRAWPDAREDGACALLDGSGLRCSVYADRPFGCRTFFCERVTGKQVASAELHRLSARLTQASDSLEPEARPVAITALFPTRK